jgi:hypothetical protein
MEADTMEQSIASESGDLDQRWLANVTYKSREGRRDVCYCFHRPEELVELIEAAQEREKVLEIEILPALD